MRSLSSDGDHARPRRPPPRIVVVGSVNIDMVVHCDRLPAPGQTVIGGTFRQLPGGKGANQAVAAARLGAAVSFVGCIGDDALGREARHALEAEGVDTTTLSVVAAMPTGVALISVDAAGQNAISVASGANAALTRDHVDAAGAGIAAADLLVCQLESPLAAIAHAVALARRAGVPVLLNPAPAPAEPLAFLDQIELLVPNEGEAAQLAGSAGEAFDPAQAAARLRRAGAKGVVVTLGAQGVLLADAEGVVRCPAEPVAVVDATGAGDAFVGALAVATAEGADLRTAAAFAQRAAAISVTRAGAMAALPQRAELGAG